LNTEVSYSRLLKRQIRRHFGAEDQVPDKLRPFLNAVDDSYAHYEQNHKLLQHTVEVSSIELSETNEKLLEEASRQNLVLKALRNSLRELKNQTEYTEKDDEDVLAIIDMLQTEIQNRKHAESRIQLSEVKYRGIIENLSLGMIETDIDGKVTKVYPQFLEMTGYTSQELIGNYPQEFFGIVERVPQVLSELKKRKQGIASAYESVIRHKNGELIWVLISGAPITNVDGEIVGTIDLHFNISGRKAMELELIEARVSAELALKARERFLANISHEIRTPMIAVIGMSSLLGGTDLNSKQRLYQTSISTASNNLLVIINDLLDLSKMSAGEFKVEKLPFELDEVIEHVQRTNKFKSEEKALFFELSKDPQLSTWLLGDPVRLNQVLVNLIGNAIKFTDVGGVNVGVKLISETQKMQKVRFSVEDTGIGIGADKLKYIFESFTQEDDTTSRDYGGTGLGLSISNQLVQLFGGEIEVESEKGKGSRFFFDLDMEVTNPPQKVINKAQFSDTSPVKGMRILLVEDNEMNRLMARSVLELWDAKITECENGQLAVDALKENDFDLVLMDMQMPVLDGVSATKTMREAGVTIPIIALTANVLQSESVKCRDAGMNAYVCKPYHPHELLKVINLASMCSKTSLDGANKSMAEFLETSADDLNTKKRLLEIVSVFESEALVFTEAVAENDLTKASVASMKIRPNIELVGMHNLAQCLEWFEVSAVNRSDLFAPMNGVFIASVMKKALKMLRVMLPSS
jgi:PAS domain S-box-containing protein